LNPFLEPASTMQWGKVSCSMKQREPLVGFEHTTDRLQVRRVTHCSTSYIHAHCRGYGLIV